MSKRILVVEDSTMMRKVIVKTLRDAGHEVVGEAANGTEALELYERLRPDLVTMDITMRGMDGITAAKEILSRDSMARILILSNMDEDKYRGEAERIGAIGLVNKHKSEQILALVGT